MAPRFQATLDYIRGLIARNEPFQAEMAARVFGIGVEGVRDRVAELRRAGLIRCSYRRVGYTLTSISIDGLGKTPWPVERLTASRGKLLTPKKHDLSAAEIAARRAEVEQAYAERQAWRAREFRGKGKGPSASSIDPYAAAIARAYRKAVEA